MEVLLEALSIHDEMRALIISTLDFCEGHVMKESTLSAAERIERAETRLSESTREEEELGPRLILSLSLE
ncbi:hypothetical protein FRC17_001801 [Serendipita sp. 399]|nr:hypothetical protein FRC17_001801 [Serendipita sp. 399]